MFINFLIYNQDTKKVLRNEIKNDIQLLTLQ